MTTTPITEKGIATRSRIVRAAADLILERGARGTSLDDIRGATNTSKSQLFHYFPGGKSDLVDAVAALQTERVLEAQRPFLDHLDSWESWEGWRDALLAHYEAQPHWGCPIGALSAELARTDPDHAAAVIAHMERWRGYLEAGLARMAGAELLRPGTDPGFLSMKIFAALHGGLALMNTFESLEPLRAGLDAGLSALRDAA
ncbi:TetR/AcrR family transcriptional regulator [Actinocrispum sp. NPDC049592]|uniref:TetR/AcrR family transcriptional regulator n=1 Tax=Actinocrispum sp. NPDC049592 TaxID=3154835 RepID=UPI0034159614